jgi:hypothetical protein
MKIAAHNAANAQAKSSAGIRSILIVTTPNRIVVVICRSGGAGGAP